MKIFNKETIQIQNPQKFETNSSRFPFAGFLVTQIKKISKI